MKTIRTLLAVALLGLALPASAQQLITILPATTSAIANGTTTRTVAVLPNCTVLDILLRFTTTGTATGSVAVFLQDSPDGGTTWDDVVSSNLFVLGAAASSQRFMLNGVIASTITSGSTPATEALTAGTTRQGPFGDRIRVREVLSGASGSPVGTVYTVTAVCKP